MERKFYFFRILPALAFSMAFHHGSLSGQTTEGKPRISFMHIAKTSKTSDLLFINDSTYFLMNRFPLEKFPNYKKLYEDKVDPYGHVDVIYGAGITPDETASYEIIWYLNNGLLYLSDIYPNVSFDKIEETFPDDELYKRMEKLTGRKFNKKYKNHTSYTVKEYKYNGSIRYNLLNPLGAMPATWFSDTIIVKQAMDEKNYREWKNIPCRELIFKKGKLVSDRIKEGMY